MKEQIRITVVTMSIFTLILGVAYPLFMCGVGQAFFPGRAGGSLLRDSSGQVIGSTLIGQNFDQPHYFHSRPSHAGVKGYDAMASGGSNLSPISKKLMETLMSRAKAYRLENQLPPNRRIPADAITASASGLDPHISVENAHIQALRIAGARNIPLELVEKAIRKATTHRWLGIFGENHVNVLLLNLELDQIPH